jgi:hypothetical protein
MRTSLRQSHSMHPRPGLASPDMRPPSLMPPQGPHVILGGHQGADGLAEPVAPGARTMFGPRGACLASADGPFFVCDTGHHRLMIWPERPDSDEGEAAYVIGQPDFRSEGRNGKGEIGAATLNVPTGVAAAGGVLAVADAWNNRVLIWHGYPERSNQPADVVLGQADFHGGLTNRGSDQPDAATLNWCYGVTIADGRLYVADTGNRRVLVWNRIPEVNGAAADLVLGQADFACRDENAGEGIGARGMRWPHAIAVAGSSVMVADAGSNRVMVWRAQPEADGAPCDFVLGQKSLIDQELNGGAYHPSAATLSMPYGTAVAGDQLIVADTANSRLIGFDLNALAMGANATTLAGQRNFSDKGDNRWCPPCRDSLCWPYGVFARDGYLVVADSGNNRVLLWEAAP